MPNAKKRAGYGDRTHGIQLGNLPAKQIAPPASADLKAPDNEIQLTFDGLLASSSAKEGPAHESASASCGLVEGGRLKRQGIDRAVESRGKDLVEEARAALQGIALSRVDRCVTADDAHYALIRHGHEPGALGNAAGSLFRPACWEFTGQRRKSTRATAHGNELKVWRYIR